MSKQVTVPKVKITVFNKSFFKETSFGKHARFSWTGNAAGKVISRDSKGRFYSIPFVVAERRR